MTYGKRISKQQKRDIKSTRKFAKSTLVAPLAASYVRSVKVGVTR